MKKIFEKAHKMTREMVKEYEVDYQAQFGLCLSYLFEEEKKEDTIEPISELKIALGEVEVEVPGKIFLEKTLKGTSAITKETEKAIQFSFKGKALYSDEGEVFEEDEIEKVIWLPKSQITVTESHIYIVGWLINKYSILEELLVW